MWTLWRFLLGAAIGSFLNVVALRYDPDKFLFSKKIIGGRSHCPHCKRTLSWFELIPLLSFIALRGKCRTCHAKLGMQYPLAELGCGLLFACIPYALEGAHAGSNYYASVILWSGVFTVLYLMALIDIRTNLIPDEIHMLLLGFGIVRIFFERRAFLFGNSSFVSHYALLFGLDRSMILNHTAGAIIGAAFFLVLIALTRGRGMGMGDAKLGCVLGILFGWPDILFIIMVAFVAGALYGIWKILGHRAKLKSAVPFGPFLALGALVLFFFGNHILGWYFSLFGLL